MIIGANGIPGLFAVAGPNFRIIYVADIILQDAAFGEVTFFRILTLLHTFLQVQDGQGELIAIN